MAPGTTGLATVADIGPAASVIVLGWSNFPPAEGLIGSEVLCLGMLTTAATMWIEHALSHGHVEIIDDYAAVAVWFDRTHGPVPLPDNSDGRLAVHCGVHTERFRRFEAFAESHHPAFPHHHLALLAVAAGRTHLLADVLLRQHHAQLDGAQLPAVVRAYNIAQVTRYEQHGYRVLARDSMDESGPMLWIMHRSPLV